MVGGGAGLGTWITLTSSPGSSDGGSGIRGRGAEPRELLVALYSGVLRLVLVLCSDPLLTTLAGLLRLARLGAEVTVGKKEEAVMVIGLAAAAPPGVERWRSSGRSFSSIVGFFSGDFLEELIVDLPESFELRVEEGKSTLVSRKPVQI